MPYDDFDRSLRCLDHKRLFKQAVEAMQILLVLTDPTRTGYRNHPATRMWRGYEDALKEYLFTCIDVIQDTTKRKKDGKPYETAGILKRCADNDIQRPEEYRLPNWWLLKRVHRSHRAMLYQKDTEFYRQFRRYSVSKRHTTYDNYVWPV
jgi:hypothetical protein